MIETFFIRDFIVLEPYNHMEIKMPGTIEQKLEDLGISLPNSPAPSANYIPFVITGSLVFISGQISIEKGLLIEGKIGKELNVDTGKRAAKACALNLISHLKNACAGDLDRVIRVVKLGGFVNATSDFTDAPQVINGASDVFVEIFGETGRHARFAVSVASLPSGAAVEIDGIFEIA